MDGSGNQINVCKQTNEKNAISYINVVTKKYRNQNPYTDHLSIMKILITRVDNYRKRQENQNNGYNM